MMTFRLLLLLSLFACVIGKVRRRRLRLEHEVLQEYLDRQQENSEQPNIHHHGYHYTVGFADEATPAPSQSPTRRPTNAPTRFPTRAPTQFPTRAPTRSPTRAPTAAPTRSPTREPTAVLTATPTRRPTAIPLQEDSFWKDFLARGGQSIPTAFPTTAHPTPVPTEHPTEFPTEHPTPVPTLFPTTAMPSSFPTAAPTTKAPVRAAPIAKPTKSPVIPPSPDFKKLVDAVAERDDLSTLAVAINRVDFGRVFDSDVMMDHTIFAPNNDAFGALDPDYLQTLTTDMRYNLHLFQLVAYHVTEGELFLSDLNQATGENITMLVGGTTDIVKTQGRVGLEGVTGVVASLFWIDVETEDGVLHVVNNVLLPPFVTLDLETFLDTQNIWTKLQQLVVAADMDGMLGTVVDATLLAPNDAGISDTTMNFLLDPTNEMFLMNVLNYHLLNTVLNFQLLPPGDTMISSLQGEGVVVTSQVDGLYFQMQRSRQFGLVARGIVFEVAGLLVPPSLQMVVP